MRNLTNGWRSRSWVFAAGVLIAAGALGGGIAGWRHLRPAAQVGAGAVFAAKQAAPLFPAGIEQDYRLEYASRVATTAGQPMTSFTLAGSLKLVGLVAGPTVVVRGAFAGTLAAEVGHDAPGADVASLVAAAQQPFLLEFGRDGSFRGARGEPGVPAFVGRFWSALGEYLQVLHGDEGRQWQVRERDASGSYLAAYEQRGAGVLSKKKVRYETLVSKKVGRYDLVSSAAQFQLDEQGRLKSLALGETTRVDLGSGPLPGFEAATTLDLRRTVAGSALPQLAAWLKEGEAAVPLSQSAREENERVRDRSLIGGMSLADALSGLKSFETTDGGGRDERLRAGRAFVALTALLRQDPTALAAVRANLEKKGPLTETLLAALRDASTPETQKLLAQMSGPGSSLGPEQRMEAARALSLVSTPTADTVDALKSLRSDPEVAAQATYGLGSALHRLNDQDPLLAGQVRAALVDQLAAAKTPADQALALTALGNAGDVGSLDVIHQYLTSDSEAVRAADAQALRRIGGAQADQMLAALVGDPAADVRYSAVDAIGERSSSAVLSSALCALAVNEPQYQVRAKAVNVLAQWSPNTPSVVDTLTVVASRDPNADLRNVARGALAKRVP